MAETLTQFTDQALQQGKSIFSFAPTAINLPERIGTLKFPLPPAPLPLAPLPLFPITSPL